MMRKISYFVERDPILRAILKNSNEDNAMLVAIGTPEIVTPEIAMPGSSGPQRAHSDQHSTAVRMIGAGF
jgi:hypothetical protein